MDTVIIKIMVRVSIIFVFLILIVIDAVIVVMAIIVITAVTVRSMTIGRHRQYNGRHSRHRNNRCIELLKKPVFRGKEIRETVAYPVVSLLQQVSPHFNVCTEY